MIYSLTSDAKSNANNVKKYKKMKIRISKYHSQFGIGVWYTWVNGIKYLVFDLGLIYIELIFKDYE